VKRLLRSGYRRLLFPGMWLLTLGASLALARDPSFDAQQLLELPTNAGYLAVVAGRIGVAFCLLSFIARRLGYRPPTELPRNVRLLIVVFYPLLSVVPQGLVWRVFFIHRYAPLFGTGLPMLAASSLAFGFAHIIFRNPIAIGVTVLGGACFVHSYLTTGSMLLADLEHAVDGLLVFNLGLGRFLYLGAARSIAPETLLPPR
jgi:uncharacterized protein